MADYPLTLPVLTDEVGSALQPLNAPSMPDWAAHISREVEAIAAELGIAPSAAFSTVTARLADVDTQFAGLSGTYVPRAELEQWVVVSVVGGNVVFECFTHWGKHEGVPYWEDDIADVVAGEEAWRKEDETGAITWVLVSEIESKDTAVEVEAARALAAEQLLAPKISPAFTGTPTAPTAAPGANTTQLATTAFVEAVRLGLLNGVGPAYDTFLEIANLLASDESTAAALATTVAAKLAKASNLSDLANAATALTNLGLTANGSSLVTAANYAAMRTLLALVIGTNVQAWDADLDTLAANGAPGTTGLALLLAANATAARATLGVDYGFPYTVDPLTTAAVTNHPTANATIFNRVHGSGSISKIAIQIGVASGNVAVAVYANSGTGRAAVPSTRRATSGSIACPSSGYAEVSLGATVAVESMADWFAFGADNTTVTAMRGTNFGSSSVLFAGAAHIQGSGFPPAAPAVPNTGFGWAYHMVGIA